MIASRKGPHRGRAAFSAAVLATLVASSAPGEEIRLEPRRREGLAEARALAGTLALAPEEFLLMYRRPDGDYSRWNLWLWSPSMAGRRVAFTGVRDGIAYLKARLADFTDPAAPRLHFIVRTDAWEKDPGADQSWHFGAARAAAVFSGDPRVYPAAASEPRIIEARSIETAPGRFALHVALSEILVVPEGMTAGFTLGGRLRVAKETPLENGEAYLLELSGAMNRRRTGYGPGS
jgi:hypothetical protein